MEEVKKYILSQVANHQLSKEEAKNFLLELSDIEVSVQEDIAIIGMSGRFPKADDPEAFWQLLKKGINCIRKFPEARLKDVEHILRNPHYSEFLIGSPIRPEDFSKVHSKGGYLEEVDKFDAAFFGISPTEAVYMDPQQRIALEVAWEAMEDAGYGGDSLVGSNTGVYIGKDGTNYSYYRLISEPNSMQLTGSWESLMASRISYQFDFRAPCMVVDTACSAGLVSIHMAAQAIKGSECDMAIAGGINVSVTGDLNPHFQKNGAHMGEVESKDGLIRSFDARANGTVWAEGAGLVLLKRLSKAIEDGDHIRGVIKGSAINNDGTTSSLTAPNAETQESAIVDAWKKANIPPETISYIEAHGTGTVLGDPIEIKGLTNSFRRHTTRRQFCAIASLKTSMGHMAGAAGATSIIKVIKSMEHKELAPTINFQLPNPYINFPDSPLYINDRRQSWVTDGQPRRAALSSFGFSRTNCHMVIEEPPKLETLKAGQPRYCLTISAKNEEVLQVYLRRYMEYLQEGSWTLADLCYTTNIGRGHYENRLVVIAETEEELLQKMKAIVYQRRSSSQVPGSYIGQYQIVSEKKKELNPGEINKRERSRISKQAYEKLKSYLDGNLFDVNLLEEVCQLYVQGADIDWSMYYNQENRRRIPAPVYPLQRTRFWAEPKISEITNQVQEVLHPLVEQEIAAPSGEHCFETILSVDEQWVLSDHRIGNKSVLPGTSYLEMVRFAAARTLGQESLVFEDVFFLAPLVVEDGSKARVRLTLSETPEGFCFTVSSQSITTSSWNLHVEGRVSVLTTDKNDFYIDIESLKKQAENVMNPFIVDKDIGVFRFGNHWDTVHSVWQIGSDSLARLQLLKSLQHELSIFSLHPSLLDNAVNLTTQSTGNTFLPLMYKKLKFYAPLSNDLYTHIRLKTNKNGGGETMTYDVDLFDGEGRLLVQISDYTVKRLHDVSLFNADQKPGVCLQMNWVPLDDSTVRKAKEVEGAFGLITTYGTHSLELEEAFAKMGIEVTSYYLSTEENSRGIVTYSPDKRGFEAILSDAEKHGIKGFLFATDDTIGSEEQEGAHGRFEVQRRTSIDALFHLCRQILKQNNKSIQLLKVLVRNAWIVDGSEPRITPLSAATAALARVIGQEYRHLEVDVLDVASDLPGQTVVNEFVQGTGLRSLRSSGVYVEELKPTNMDLNFNLSLKTEGVYIITGGLGGLGFSIAERLANKGKVNVVLVGRSSLAPSSEWESLKERENPLSSERYSRLIELRKLLNSLEYVSMDVTDVNAVQQLGKDLKVRFGSISGIFHAAGVAGDGFLMLKEEVQFKRVLNPKLNGSMNLFNLLDKNSGFLALFSSITALTGGKGQGDYSAANAFMDSLADMGRLADYNVISINWPSWKEVGMSVDYELDQAENLFIPIGVKEGLDWLEHLITEPQSRIIPSTMNMSLIGQLEEQLPFRIASEITKSIHVLKEVASSQELKEVEVTIVGELNPTHTQAILSNTFGSLLGLTEIDIYNSFQDMGGNSLMATQLLKAIEEQFPGIVDISDLFSYPSVYELSEFIDSHFEKESKANSNGKHLEVVDQELVGLIEEELQGTEYLDEFLDQIKVRREDDK